MSRVGWRMMTFAELGLSAPTLESLAHLGYERPTPIQERAPPPLLDGRDVVGQAQTGTGKTAAFGLPMIEYADAEDPNVQALVLTPTRELCIQVTQALRAYARGHGLEVVAVFGGAPIRDQAVRLKEGQIVVGTVGRVMDMMDRHHLFLDQARYVVLDEADEMLDLGFLEDVEAILRRCPMGRQTSLFSATVPPEIQRLADTFMHDPVRIKVRAATLTIDTVDHYYVEVPDREKPDALVRVLKEERPEQAIVFVRTKIGVDRLARRLGDAGVRVKTLHGDMSQGQRDGVMIAFKGGRERLLVATDVAARGLDITGVSHVVNYDIPNSPDVYVHRIGRTGRAGESGRAITLITRRQGRGRGATGRRAKTERQEWPPENPSPRGRHTRQERETRRPRHTKPHARDGVPYVKLFEEDAPKTVENFVKLSRDGYYDGLIFHRVIKDFMIQGGCPQGTGTGGPGYEFEDEINDHKIVRGALAMANRGPNTNGSQFFIVTTDAAPWLDGKHTVFGEVRSGMEAVDSIEGTETGAQDRPAKDAVIERVEVHAG